MSERSRKKSEEPAGIDVTEAVKRAAAFLKQVFGGESVKDIRLEEVEFVEDKDRWLVTLSFLRPIPAEELPGFGHFAQSIMGEQYRREYKAVDVDGRTGRTRSIKMRSPV